MSSSVGVMDFFVVEANEYIERLDALLGSAGSSGPEADSFGRHARALRGSATMSRQAGIAELAGALERVARALRAHSLSWQPAVNACVVSAVDDLRILVRNARSWSPDDERRVRTRFAELEQLAPAVAQRRTPPRSSPAGGAFLAGAAADLARALDAIVVAPEDRATLAAVAERVRALRGVADVRDVPTLRDVVDAVERTLKTLELGTCSTSSSARQTGVFSAAAAVLRRTAREIDALGRAEAQTPELDAFNAAVTALADEDSRADRIVPISQLFHDDAGPHVVATAPNPPTRASERFRLEVVSLAEHLRGVINDARRAHVAELRERAARELRDALRALGSSATSFGEAQVARFAAEWTAKVASLDSAALDALDSAATLLANAETRADQLTAALERLTAPPRTPVRTPTGRQLHDLLEDGLVGIRALEEQPLAAPLLPPDNSIVPIEQLLYRGRGALRRAAELRAELRRSGAAPSTEAVEELFDLLDLALVE
jgi:hypothetical protein